MVKKRRTQEATMATRLNTLQKVGVALAVGAAAGNLAGCTVAADTAPKSVEVADDQFVDKLELSEDQLVRVTKAAKATAVARIDFVKKRIAQTDPNNEQHSVYNYEGSLVMSSRERTYVEEKDYNLDVRNDMLYVMPAQSANGLEMELRLSHDESCYKVEKSNSDPQPCKAGEKNSYSTLTFINPESQVFSDFLLTEEELREYLASPDTALKEATKSKETTNSQGKIVDTQFVSVEIDGATVLKKGRKQDILEKLTVATNY